MLPSASKMIVINNKIQLSKSQTRKSPKPKEGKKAKKVHKHVKRYQISINIPNFSAERMK